MWQSALLLPAEVLAHPAWARGLDVVELGCGAGLPSVAAALAGARSVLATDRAPDACRAVAAAAAAGGAKRPETRDSLQAPPVCSSMERRGNAIAKTASL